MRQSRFAIMLAMSAFVLPAQAQPSTVSEIKTYLAAHNGRATIERYFDLEKGEGYRLVETGRPDAVALAVRLLRDSDAAVTTSLLSSLGTAMTAHPDVVLPYLHQDRAGANLLTPSRICLPFMDAEEPRQPALAQLARSRQALERVRTAALQAPKQECLARIALVERNVRQRP